MRIRIEALNKKAGMTIVEIEAAIEKARNANCINVPRAVVGLSGQIKAIEFSGGAADEVSGHDRRNDR